MLGEGKVEQLRDALHVPIAEAYSQMRSDYREKEDCFV